MLVYLILITTSLAHINLPIKAKKSFRLASAENIELSKKSTFRDYYAQQYYADFKVGTPGQSMSMILDTGSSYTWVPKINCSCLTSTHQFNATTSSTYKDKKISKNLQYEEYGEGYIEGTLSTDIFSIDGLEAKDMNFILVSKSSGLKGLAADGLLGLAFNKLSDGYPVFVEELYNQNAIKEKVFSFYLGESSEKDTSFITFGGSESEYKKGKTKQVIEIDSARGYWLSIIYSVSIDSENISNDVSNVIFDTGKSVIYGPKYIVNKIYESLEKKFHCHRKDLLLCECSNDSCLEAGNLEFEIGFEIFVITPENYLYCEDGYCWVLIGDSGGDSWHLNQPLFREYYSVYDMSIPQMELYRNNDLPTSYKFYWIILGIILGIILLVGIGAIIFYAFLKKSNSENEPYRPLS